MEERSLWEAGQQKNIILQAFHWNLVKRQGSGTTDGRGLSWFKLLAEFSGKIAGIVSSSGWKTCYEKNGEYSVWIKV